MKKIKKAIIPAAGLGTRFLPETKAMPKEMLPVVDKPAIQLIVEEAIASGITDILIIIGKGKRAIEDHFDSNTELELNLKETNGLNIYFKRQEHPNGLGDAVHTAKSFVGEDPFVIMLGDDLMTDETPLTKQLIDSYEETGSSTLAVMKVPHEDTSKYGVINPAKEVSDGLYDVTNFVEKPNPEDAPSDLAIIGRYLLTADIFDILENTKPGKGNEIQLTDAIDTLNKKGKVYAHEFKGDRYDTGNKFGWLQTNIEFGLKHPEVSDELKQYIKDLAKKLD